MNNRLPIYDVEDEIVSAISRANRVIIEAPTGSGKSTQVPQILLKSGIARNGKVVILQPRRLAARMLARRVAREMGVNLGEEVGYQVRFDDVSSQKTKIKYVTEGLLLRQMITDPALSDVEVVIFDEFHERHLYGDITLSCALDLQEKKRPDLQIIVMSATLNTEEIEKFLSPCERVYSDGRAYPVEIRYIEEHTDYSKPIWKKAVDAFVLYKKEDGEGDVLIFMPGAYEIRKTIEMLEGCPEAKGHIILPLHGELPPSQQDAAIERYSKPKIVVSTNIAETSITIEGIRLVIDSGLARIPRYDPDSGVNMLTIEEISQASADQRAGRAGRTAPGVCIRLWGANDHKYRRENEIPEIKRLDLAEVALTLKALGIEDLSKFRWAESPGKKALEDLETFLKDLGATDEQGRITEIGRRMAAFPLHPRYSRMLLTANDYCCVYQIALIAALSQSRWLLKPKADKEIDEYRKTFFSTKAPSDFFILMSAFKYAVENNFDYERCLRVGINQRAAIEVNLAFNNFLNIAKALGLDVTEHNVKEENIQKCILTGFSDNVARRIGRGNFECLVAHKRQGDLSDSSVVTNAEFMVVSEIKNVEDSDGTIRTKLSLATEIKKEWLFELYPDDIVKSEPSLRYVGTERRIYAEETTYFRNLPIHTRIFEPQPDERTARLLAENIAKECLVIKDWDNEVEQWILRVNLLNKWCPELGIPPITEEDRLHLLEQICIGALSYKQVKDKPVKKIIYGWLSDAQRELLNKYAPDRIKLSNGRTPKIVYTTEGTPYIALRIQELYGVNSIPRIAMDRITPLVHILAPNMRPVQITNDIASFWVNHYPSVKQELKRLYPKHEWR